MASNSNIQIAASNSAFSSSEVVSHPDELESASSLNVGNESDFPRVFKEFDFLEAERDTISETESCFNWLSTMRPLCSAVDDNAADVEDVEGVDNDEFNDQDEQNAQMGDELIDELDSSVSRGSMTFVSHRRSGRLSDRFSRPISRTSDSNDFSSDKTPGRYF